MTRELFYERLATTLRDIREEGLWKEERIIVSPQGPEVEVESGGQRMSVLNLCANNYLGLADHPEIEKAAVQAMDRYGFGMASVRFICGTLDLHRRVEHQLADWLGYDGLHPLRGLLRRQRCGVRAPARRRRRHRVRLAQPRVDHRWDPALQGGAAPLRDRRPRGSRAPGRGRVRRPAPERSSSSPTGCSRWTESRPDIAGICEVADRHGALVMVDDCHATGFIGPEGRGTPALHGVAERVDIVTSTLGKALGGEWAVSWPLAARSSICCDSGPSRICSPTRSHPP